MLSDLLTSKWAWGVCCSGLLITGIYRVYLTNLGPAAVQGAFDKIATDSFGACLTADTFTNNMKYCDKFYLEYLPQKTDPKYQRKIIEISKVSPQSIVKTYKKLVLIREEYGLIPYPELSELTTGQLSNDGT